MVKSNAEVMMMIMIMIMMMMMQGVERVVENPGEFAYLLESKSADYAIGNHCGLSTIGGNINMRSYGIAVKQGNKEDAVML